MARLSDGRPDPRSTPQWQRLRIECYRRDKARDAPCAICGQRHIDYAARPSSTPDSYEPDHIRPVERYPELALLPENVQPAARRCNRAKGKRAGVDVMGNRSRDWTLGR